MNRINKDVAFDIFLRVLSCVCIGFFIANLLAAYSADKTRITLAAAVISEVTTIVISLASRRPMARDWRLLTVAATIYATSIWLPLININSVFHLLNETTSAAVQFLGILWVINAKITLGRSFGWLPANRGIVDTGVYRLVRHPIYFGYLVTHAGFLLANFNMQNTAVFASVYVAQLYRIFQEEKFLMQDESYRSYASRVRYRLIYGVF